MPGDGEPRRCIHGLEAKGKMRSLLVAVTALTLFAAGTAQAKVAITVDKDNQQMTVAVDGVERYHWPVSSGIPSYETPNGSFRTFRMEEDHFSRNSTTRRCRTRSSLRRSATPFTAPIPSTVSARRPRMAASG